MKAVIRILVNLFLAICVLWAWISMIMGQNGMFMSVGLASLKWFTVLSNLLEAHTVQRVHMLALSYNRNALEIR